jgi:hypothetical protein
VGCKSGSGPQSSDDETGDTTGHDTGIKFDVTPGGDAEAGMEGGDDGCAEINVAVEPVTPTIVLLVDQSGSMTGDFAGQPRWDAVYETLMDPNAGVVQSLESTVRFGLALYTSMDGDAGGMCPLLTEVGPALDNHAAIDAVYAPEVPIDETPTGESLAEVANGLDVFPEEGPKAIVLATDGEPDTCAVPNPQQGQAEALAAAQFAFVQGIETYIISVGDDVSAQHLQEMANAGVGLDPQGQELAPYYQALDAGDLITAFEDIIGGFISCSFELEGIVDLLKTCEGTVWLDDVELECGVDWELSDPSTLVLLGEACETLRDGNPHSVEATWPCDAVEIP